MQKIYSNAFQQRTYHFTEYVWKYLFVSSINHCKFYMYYFRKISQSVYRNYIANQNREHRHSEINNFKQSPFIQKHIQQFRYKKSMRFTNRIKKEEVPEWGDCYIGYKHLKILLKVLQECVQERLEFDKYNKTSSSQGSNSSHRNRNTTKLNIPIKRKATEMSETKLKQKSDKANTILIQTLNKQIQLFGAFVRNKFAQISNRFKNSLNFYQVSSNNQKLIQKTLVPYLQCIFVQASDLAMMYQTNMQAERRIIDKHLLYSENLYPTPAPRISMEISIHSINKLLKEIQKFYVRINGSDHKASRTRLHKLAQIHQKTNSDSMLIGLMIGIFIAVCIFLGLILAYREQYVQGDPIFNRDFPTWRGIALFVFYIWSLGINTHHYERHNISHRTILENTQTKYPTSTNLYKFAGFFSAILVVVFTLYVLDIADIIKLQINPQILPIFVWIPFIVLLVNPISIFYFRSRDYLFKLLFKILISFAIPATYPIAYGTDQFTSLFVPIRDGLFTICYYARGNFTTSNQQIIQNTGCRFPVDVAIFVFSIVIFCYRIMQCVKFGFQAQPYCKRDFFNGVKYTVALVSTILSYLLQFNRSSVFPAWVIFAVGTSIYTYFWDLKYDWLLLDKDSGRFLLRDKITYPKKFYYVLIVVNLFLRCSWVLTISPEFSEHFFGSPEIFILLFAFLEIIRRGIWNMLSVEAEQYKNCKLLNALPKYFFTKQKQLKQILEQNKDKIEGGQSIQRINNPQIESVASQTKFFAKQKEHIFALVQARRQKIKQTKKFLRESNSKDQELIDYLHKDYESN